MPLILTILLWGGLVVGVVGLACCWADGTLGVLPDDDFERVDEHTNQMRTLDPDERNRAA